MATTYVSSGQVRSGISICLDDCMVVCSGGQANYTTVDLAGKIFVSSGGTANYTTVDLAGMIFVSSGGKANRTTVTPGGCMDIDFGGTANDTTVNGRGHADEVTSGYLYVGGTANATTVNSGGYLYVYSGGTALQIKENGGYVGAYGNVTFVSNSFSGMVLNYNSATVHSGTTANSTTVNSGSLEVYSGGTANTTTINSSGRMYVSNGGKANSTTLNAGGRLTVSSGGMICGLLIASGGIVSMGSGAIVGFDLRNRTAADPALITNFDLINGTPKYTISVSSTQTSGIYKLADGVTSFTAPVKINVIGEGNNTIRVDNSLEIGDFNYSLGLSSNILYLTIQCLDTIPPDAPTVSANITVPTNQNVTVSAVFSSDSVTKQYSYDGNNWKTYTLPILMSENGIVYFRGTDKVGNCSNVTSYTVTNIDKVSPDAPTASADVTTLTNQSVTVSAVFSDDSVKKEYSLDNQTWNDYTNPIIMAENGIVYFRGTDEAGNKSNTTSYSVTNIGKVAASADVTAPTNQSVTVTAVFSDDTVKKEYSLDNQTWNDYTAPIVMNANGSVYFRSTDETGNNSHVTSYTVTNIDKVAPNAPTASMDVTTPTNQVTITAVFSSDSVIKQYSFNNQSWNDYKSPVVMTKNGTVYFRGIDDAGNISEITSHPVTNIVVPTILSNRNLYVSNGYSVYYTTINYGGNLNVYSGGTANNTTINSSGCMRIYDGGIANYATVNTDGTLNIFSGGTINSATVEYDGNIHISNGGIATNTHLNEKGYLRVHAGGIASNTILSSRGKLYVSKGGLAKDVLLLSGIGNLPALLKIYAGASATNITASSGAYIENHGITDSSILSGGTLFINSGASGINTVVESSGRVNVYNDATASSTTVKSGGYMEIQSKGTAKETTVSSGGHLEILSGGTVHDLQIKGGASVYANTGAVINFDLTERTSADGTLLTNHYLMEGSPDYTISVSSTQASGLYKLADGVASFTAPITINVIGGGSNTIRVGNSVEIGDFKYSLALNSNLLSLSVQCFDTIPPEAPTARANITAATNQNVTVTAVFSSDSAVREYSLNGTQWQNYTSGVVMSENGTVYFRGKDAAGNISNVTRYTVSNIDRISPNKPTVSANTTAATNQNVTVSAVFTSDSAVREYSLDGTHWQNYTSGVVMSENGTVYFRGTDTAGNISDIASYTVNNIDKVAPNKPTASANITSVTNQDVTVSATFSNDSVQKQYSLDNTTWNTYATGVVMSENGTVYFRGIDEAGNISEVTAYSVANIDKIAPVKPTARANITANTNQDVTVYASFSSDSVEKQYSRDNANWYVYNDNGVIMSSNGAVYFRGIDGARNISDVTSYTVNNIDKVAPVKPTASADITAATNRNVTVSAVFSADSIQKQYSLDNASWNTYTTGIVMSENGTVYFRGIDAVGNISEITSYTVSNIDKIQTEAPENLTVTVKNYDATLTWNKVTAPKDMKVSYEVRIDGEDTFTTTSNKYTFKKMGAGEHTFEVRTVLTGKTDSAVSEWSDEAAANIKDVTAPTVGTLYVTQDGEDSVLLTWTPGSDNVGIDHYIVTCGKLEDTVDFPETGYLFEGVAGKLTVTLTAVDEAGNKSKTVKKNITLKDVTPPEEVTGLRSQGVNNKTGGTLAWDVPEDNVGVTQYLVRVDGKEYKTKTNSLKVNKLNAGEHSFTVIALDKEQNRSEVSEECIFEVEDRIPPKTGALNVVQSGEESIKLTWAPATDDSGKIGSYIVTCGNETDEVDGGENSYEFAGVAGKLNVTLTAVDEGGNKGNTVKKSITLKDVTPPDEVTGLSADEATNNSNCTLHWDVTEDNVGVDQYIVILDGKTYKSKTNSLTVKKLAAGEHEFSVAAVDKAKNQSEMSEICSFEVEDVIAPKIKKFSAKLNKDNTATVTWNASDETEFDCVEFTLDDDETFDSDLTSGTLTLPELYAGTHTLLMTAYDASGNFVEKSVSLKVKGTIAAK